MEKVIDREKIRAELHQLIDLIKKSQSEHGKIPPFQKLVEAALEGAEKLHIPIPNGLLLMVKSILTIEGLAKGIDADVSFTRVAAPVLFWAARPEFSDIIAMAKQLPRAATGWIKKAK